MLGFHLISLATALRLSKVSTSRFPQTLSTRSFCRLMRSPASTRTTDTSSESDHQSNISESSTSISERHSVISKILFGEPSKSNELVLNTRSLISKQPSTCSSPATSNAPSSPAALIEPPSPVASIEPLTAPATASIKPLSTPATASIEPLTTPATASIKPLSTPATASIKPLSTPATASIKPLFTAALTKPLPTVAADNKESTTRKTQVRSLFTVSPDMNTLDTVVSKLKTFAPLSLAGSWDNVGLLVEPSPPKYISKMMLTNDLTNAVMEEAKEQTVDLILAYHPPIFSPLKRLTQASWKERLLVECLESRIAVFSPHTSYDAVQEGVNDWLISAFDIKENSLRPVEAHEQFMDGLTHVLEIDVESSRLKQMRDEILVAHLPPEARLRNDKDAFTSTVIKSKQSQNSEMLRLRVECSASELRDLVRSLTTCKCPERYSVSSLSKVPQPNTGPGRIGELSSPVNLETAVGMVKSHLGLDRLQVAKSQVFGKEDAEINTVAVCAGSGSSVFRGVKADLLLSGEMSHHDVLDAVHRGCHVILCHHSNTERGYLYQLRDKLVKILGNSVDIFVSQTDRDPLEIM